MNRSPLRRASGRILFFLAVLALVAQGVAGAAQPAAAAPKFKTADGRAEAIVELEPGSDPSMAAAALGLTPRHVYRGVISGFAADLPADAVARLRADSRVRSVTPDGKVSIQGRRVGPEIAADAEAKTQRASTGVGRIGTVLPKKDFDIDVAIIDTGVGPSDDLNIAGGFSCLKPDTVGSQKKGKGKGSGKGGSGGVGLPDYSDGESHGTHVAGIVAAINNKDGVVGIASGARIWAVRVLGSSGTGKWSDVVCGLDWVYANRATIEVVNMSLAGNGTDSGKCSDLPVHKAICQLVNKAGIPVVVAAGNQSKLASTRIPAAYAEVIAVSAFSDSDGRPGGLGPQSCEYNADDSFWGSSNFGPAVDVAAPGDCILSITPRGLARYSGTSMATPHVTGAIARFLTVVNPSATPAQVRAWLLSDGSRPQQAFEGFSGGKSSEQALWLGPAPVPTP
ncbi:MAG: S8 family serine peptidase [Chloroflexota bacterium]